MKRRDLLKGGALGVGSLLLPLSPRIANAGPEPSLLVVGGEPHNLATPIEYLDRLITPTPVFFVRSHFGPPALDRNRVVRVEGTKQTLELRARDLRQFEEVTLTACLQCAGNGRALHEPHLPGLQWGHGGMSQATWTGVRLRDVLARAGVDSASSHVRLQGADRPPKPKVPAFIRSLPISRALDPTTLIAHRMNGESLGLEHGAPFRLVVPGWTGNHWVKWLTSIRVQTEEAEGFFTQTGYRMPRAPIVPGTALKPADTVPVTALALRSLIARPLDGAHLRGRKVEIAGVAIPGTSPIARVEVSTDEGSTWSDAHLAGDPGVGRWNVFHHTFEAPRPGVFRAIARAFDATGEMQPEKATWNPSGYLWNGWHKVSFEVKA